MDDRKLNEQLAEWFEPLNMLPDPKLTMIPRSPMGVWLLCWANRIRFWEPRDFIAEFEMRDFCQQRLLSMGWEIHVAQFPQAENCTMKLLQRSDGIELYIDAPFERIWALALARAVGITESGIQP